MIKCFGNKIKIQQTNYRTELVCSPRVKKGQATESAFETAALDSKGLEETALIHLKAIDYEGSQTVPRITLVAPYKCAIEKQTVPTPECYRFYELLSWQEKVT